MTETEETCSWGSAGLVEPCPRPARAAIRTTRPTRADVRVTVYTDNRVAPKTASRYCHQHAQWLLRDLLGALVDGDDDDERRVDDVST